MRKLLGWLFGWMRGPWVTPDPSEAPPTCEVEAPPAPPAPLEVWRVVQPRPGVSVVGFCGWAPDLAAARQLALGYGRGVYRTVSLDGREWDCWAQREVADLGARPVA